ncbi:glycosyltransferase family 2 protein [Aliagarivorans marinus]|uniref:glycosyltransferase family 2 protein n=1 Tax=Aliagarivorans marinus TaxID=561965 RepID=UPI00040035D6|nr:glycosyltransferase family 2 protein [Aliagarivorans marinus]
MSSNLPLVTIGISAYNEEKLIDRAINSALSQTYSNIEIILFDDASSDNTLGIMRQFGESNLGVKVFSTNVNKGLAHARNRIKEAANGDYLAWLDADDEYRPNRISKLVNTALESKSDVTIDGYIVVNENGEEIKRQTVKNKFDFDSKYTSLFERNFMLPHPLISRRCFSSINFDETLEASEDYDYWLKCSTHGYSFTSIKEFNLVYTLRTNSMSSSNSKNMDSTRKILSKYDVVFLEKLLKERNFSTGYINKASCLFSIFTGSFEKAISYSKKHWEDDPDNDRDFYIGTLYALSNNFYKAKYHLEKHLSRLPESPAGYNNLAVVVNNLSSKSLSKKLVSKALEIFPSYTDASTNMVDPKKLTLTQISINKSR